MNNETEEAIAEAQKAYQSMKKSLKARSKSQLIELIAMYASDLQEQRKLNKFLYEENKELKGEEVKND